MAKFLTTNGISYYIEEIIREAKSEIVLLSPYLKISTNLFDRLKDADRKSIKITLIYGKDELSYDQEKMLLLETPVGEGIFFAGQKHVAIKIVASYTEDQIITTNPEQLKNQG